MNAPANDARARELGDDVLPVACDISDPAAARAGHARIVERLGPVDILVNNAGILSNNKVEATDDAEWRRVLAANLDGAFYLVARGGAGDEGARAGAASSTSARSPPRPAG